MSFYSEIMEQPEAARRLLAAFGSSEYRMETEKLLQMVKKAAPAQFVFTGMGSSLFVSYIAASILRRAGISAVSLEAREAISFDRPIIQENTILVAISQSGNSLETVEFCELYKDFPNLVTVTNLKTSNLHKYGTVRFTLEAGPEKHTATKSYTNTVLAILYMAYVLVGRDLENLYADVEKMAGTMETLLSEPVGDLVDFWEGSSFTALVGSGVSYCTVSHASLVLMEAAHINAAYYTVGQFIHGPIEIIDEHFCTILFDFEPEVRRDLDRVADLTLQYGGKVLLLTNRTDVQSRENLRIISMDCPNPMLSPMADILPIELMTLEIGIRAGLHPGDLYRVHK